MRDEPIGELNPPNRVLLTPGPSCVDPRVYRAMATPIVGHLDPWFMDMMSEVQILLRRVFRTDNRVTFPLSASGSGGIEAAVLNALEAGDECLICVNGVFSESKSAFLPTPMSSSVTPIIPSDLPIETFPVSTPIEPVKVPGSATILSAEQDT